MSCLVLFYHLFAVILNSNKGFYTRYLLQLNKLNYTFIFSFYIPFQFFPPFPPPIDEVSFMHFYMHCARFFQIGYHFHLCRRIEARDLKSTGEICFLAAVSVMPGQVLDEPGAQEAGVKKFLLASSVKRIAARCSRNFSSGEIVAKECLQIVCEGIV